MSDVLYNSDSREIHIRFEIYFTEGGDPLIVTKDNYLVSSSILEEAQGDAQTILGGVSSNEITLDLHNDDRIFTPTNTLSPYYGRMRKGIKIKVFGSVTAEGSTSTEEALGTYYVTQWSTTSAGLVASITADDVLYNVFDAPKVQYNVIANETIRSLYANFFNALGVAANIDVGLSSPLLFSYISGENKDFITDLTNGALAMCYGNRLGGVDVISRLTNRGLRATITDDDQIINVDAEQSIEAGYDGTSVTKNIKQESATTNLVSLVDHSIIEGRTDILNVAPSTTPVVRLRYGDVIGNSNANIVSLSATPETINCVVASSEATTANVNVFGTYLDSVSATHADTGNNLLALDSNYIQTDEQLNKAISYLQRAISVDVPLLVVDVRGNLSLKLGDKIRVRSSQFKTDYTGVIVRNNFSYDGGLKCTLTLMNASLFGGGS